MIDPIEEFPGLSCTIVTTEDCNLRCKYCYENHRTSSRVDLDTAKRFIHLISSINPEDLVIKEVKRLDLNKSVVFDFIGGDSLIDPSLLDKLMRYINSQMGIAMSEGRYVNGWRASLSTNGTLFGRPDVREFCEKWRDNLSVGVSIDGCPEIHDMNRVYRDGRGSMKDILKWWGWYQNTFGEVARSAKSTLSKNSIPYIYDSVRFMYETMGIKWQMMNFIMEDTGCRKEDYILLESQLDKTIEYVLDHRKEMYCRLFDKSQFVTSLERKDKDHQFNNSGWCGSGFMPTMNIDGKIYSCFRWCPLSQHGDNSMKIGSVDEGITNVPLMKHIQKCSFRSFCTMDKKCLSCKYEPACSYCIAGCYDEFHSYVRTTHICEITKILCKKASEYWKEYERLEG